MKIVMEFDVKAAGLSEQKFCRLLEETLKIWHRQDLLVVSITQSAVVPEGQVFDIIEAVG